jgi:hypothetical protein
MTIKFRSIPNYCTKQYNNDTSTRDNRTSNYIDNRFVADTLYNGLKVLNLIDALPAAPTV